MHISIKQPDSSHLVVTLREGDVTAEVTGWRPDLAAEELLGAFDAAREHEYGDCYWFEPTGQYWWMLKRDEQRLELVVMHSEGVGRGWQHVFRAVDEMDYFQDLVKSELAQFGLAGR
jgi:hypothetical protein